MEATAQQGVGEVRRLHIIYFISRKGRIEHPHLIRVHHLSRNGVRLRDIKRWLSELRGKDMPESYAWSYKRRYKTGFVWQDLLDENLITPIADNEYVLKGSEIPSLESDHELGKSSDGKEEGIKRKEKPACEAKFNDRKSSSQATSQEQESPTSMLTKPLLEIEEQSSTFSSDSSMSLNDDSPKFEPKNHLNSRKEREDHSFPDEEAIQEVERETLREKEPFIPNLASDNKKTRLKNFGKPKKPDSTTEQSSSKPKFTKSRSYSNNASNIFRNLLTCGTVDTKDSSMMVIKRKSTSSRPSKLDLSTYKANQNTAQICGGDVLGGSERISRNFWHETQENVHRKSCDGASHSRQKKKEMNGQKPVPPAYRPRNGPNCSQCGKTFDPNQLHKHMSSCRGMKALAKAAAAATTPANTSYSHRRSTDSPRRSSSSFRPLLD